MNENEKDRSEPRRGLPRVAIVGRPNVGKSSLFNRLLGRREAIVLDRPGVTRDWIERPCRLTRRWVCLHDTGGIVPEAEEDLLREVSRQAVAALDLADVLVLVIDGRAGITPADHAVAGILRKAQVPVLLAVNKIDEAQHEILAAEAWELGLGEPEPVSAEHGLGVDTLAERIEALLPEGPEEHELEPPPQEWSDPGEELCVAVAGRPNVGKSSLVNRLVGTQRATVSSVPGTTRDAIDVLLKREGRLFRLVDTAGLRRRAKVAEKDEGIGILMTRRRLERAHAAILVLDSVAGVTSGDVAIAGEILDLGRPLVLALNKWDLIKNPEIRTREIDAELGRRLSFAPQLPRVTVSALTGQRVFRLLDLCREVVETASRRVPTAELNRFLNRTLGEHLASGGGSPKMLYMTQTGHLPPRFVVFVRDPQAVNPHLRRFLENRLRDAFDLGPVPVFVDFQATRRNPR